MTIVLILAVIAVIMIIVIVQGFMLMQNTQSINAHTRAIDEHTKVLRIHGDRLEDHRKRLEYQWEQSQIAGKKFRVLERIVSPCTCSMDPMAPHPEPDCPQHGM